MKTVLKMNTFVLEIWDDESERVSFYSVRWEDTELSEMDKFLIRMKSISAVKRPLQELLNLILNVIGDTYGASEEFFNRFENNVTALPPHGTVKISQVQLNYKGCPLRLYCLVLSEEVVVLFNGGIKDSRSVQESTDSITTKFYEANEFGKRILAALRAGEIFVEGRRIVDYKGDTEIYL